MFLQMCKIVDVVNICDLKSKGKAVILREQLFVVALRI